MARYDTSKPFELARLTEFLTRNTGKKIDVSVVRQKRSYSQNAYYHLLLGYFGSQAGLTMEETKQLIRNLQPDLYQFKKKKFGDCELWTSRSSADLDSGEMTKSIDRFRDWAAEQGIDLPLVEDKPFMEWAAEQVAKHADYL